MSLLIVMKRSFFALALGSFLSTGVASAKEEGVVSASWCFTYLSIYLDPIEGVPIYYLPGEIYKQLGGRGSPPDGAITTTFDIVNDNLQFVNSALPDGRAGFCQVPDSGIVYITYLSEPDGCVEVVLTVVPRKQHPSQFLVPC